jgi:two-component system NtrC family sensor kinase
VFSQRDLYLLDMLAPQGAVAIRNAQLFMELEARMKELSRTQAQLLQSEKLASIGRMAGTMAHEVNNPLHSINNCLHIGLRSGVSAEKRTTYLKMARQEVQRLMGTVGQLLNFYRPAQSERERISVVELVNKVLALLDKQLSKQDIKINRKFEDVPPVWVVRDHIHQVLLNLLLNAADAMPQGGTIHVEITHPVGDEVAIFIIDEGPGIDAEMLPLIFEPFVTTKMQGTGLGLATSLSIIEAHGGQMRVTSQPNEGACFAVILPIISNSEALTV